MNFVECAQLAAAVFPTERYRAGAKDDRSGKTTPFFPPGGESLPGVSLGSHFGFPISENGLYSAPFRCPTDVCAHP